ncbi:MAG TPA: histidine phosphatase family protein [bacterium]|nr:histidine phosphatase family protein [bacterium]
MTRIFLVRHGKTVFNKETTFRGVLDVPLNDVGKEQAALTGRAMSGIPMDVIKTGPLSRAFDTAAEIALHQEAKPVPEEAFNDLDFGRWQGLTLSEVEETEPELLHRWQSEPQSVRLPGGESIEDVSARSVAALDKLVEENEGKNILIVSHRVVIKLLSLHMLGMPVSGFWKIWIDTCGITEFHSDPRFGYILVRLNNTAHLGRLEPNSREKDF